MKKKLLALVVLLTCVFSITSCAVFPAYHGDDLTAILEDLGYEVEEVTGITEEGISGCIYAKNPETGDELYYIYCEDFSSARSIRRYVNSQKKAKIAEIKMKMKKIEYKLYKDENVTAAEKGVYYEKYVLLKEELKEVRNYGCGRAVNVVWYGTNQAILDLRLGK